MGRFLHPPYFISGVNKPHFLLYFHLIYLFDFLQCHSFVNISFSSWLSIAFQCIGFKRRICKLSIKTPGYYISKIYKTIRR